MAKRSLANIVFKCLSRDAGIVLALSVISVFPPIMQAVVPFPPGTDSTTDPWVTGFPFMFFCYCALYGPDWESLVQMFFQNFFVVDFFFWLALGFGLDFTYSILVKRQDEQQFSHYQKLAC